MKNLPTKNSGIFHGTAHLLPRFSLHTKACLGVRRLDAAFIFPQQTIQNRRQAVALQSAYAREKCAQHKHNSKFAGLAYSSSPKRAFTLVEVMVAIAVFTMVIGGTMAAFFTCNRLWQSTSLSMQASSEANIAMSRIIYGLGTNDGLRTASGIQIDTDFRGIHQPQTGEAYPPPANAMSHWITHDNHNTGSWRLIITNMVITNMVSTNTQGTRVTWIDYNNVASNIVFWPATNTGRHSRQGIANYVSAASLSETNGGLEIMIEVTRKHGNLVSSNEVRSFIRMRNR